MNAFLLSYLDTLDSGKADKICLFTDDRGNNKKHGYLFKIVSVDSPAQLDLAYALINDKVHVLRRTLSITPTSSSADSSNELFSDSDFSVQLILKSEVDTLLDLIHCRGMMIVKNRRGDKKVTGIYGFCVRND